MYGEHFEGASEVLDFLSVGFIVTTEKLQIICANAAARRRLIARDCLHDDNGVIGAVREGETEHLQRCVQVAATTGDRGVLLLSTDRALQCPVDILPWPRHNGAALIVLHTANAESSATARHLESAYGLTASEADIVAQLACGLDTLEIANSRHTSPSTVRVQIVLAKVKMGVQKQRELVSAATRCAFLA